jgi:hypothetical protein
MPQKWLSVRQSDYERCKTDAKGKPWVKVHRDLLRDHAFLKLKPSERFLYIGLLYLAIETQNKIYNDSTHLGQVLYINHTEIDLKPLYRYGLLVTSNVSRALLDRDREREGDREGERVEDAPQPQRINPVRGSVFPEGFRHDSRAEALASGYGLNIHKEVAAFRDYHVAKGSVFKDWQAALRTWLRNSVKFSKRGA